MLIPVCVMQGGSKTSGAGLEEYLLVEAQHWAALKEEYVVSHKRAKLAMARYRAQRSAWDIHISTLLRRMAEVVSDKQEDKAT